MRSPSTWPLSIVLLVACQSSEPTDSETSPGPTEEQCLAETDRSSCEAIGCRFADTVVLSAECTVAGGSRTCFTLEGQPVGQSSEPHAYYRQQGSIIEYMVHGYDCAAPLGWTECDSEPNSPPGCACLCGTTVDGDPVLCGTSPLCD